MQRAHVTKHLTNLIQSHLGTESKEQQQELNPRSGYPKSGIVSQTEVSMPGQPQSDSKPKEHRKEELTFEMLSRHPIGIEYLKDQMQK